MNKGNGDIEKNKFWRRKHELQKIGQTTAITAMKTPPSMPGMRSIS